MSARLDRQMRGARGGGRLWIGSAPERARGDATFFTGFPVSLESPAEPCSLRQERPGALSRARASAAGRGGRRPG